MPTARSNPTEFAILGLLSEGPRSGYDIKKEVEERMRHFWSESFGHIYPMLTRLHGKRLVSVRTVPSARGRPDRKLYTITAAGRRALAAWFQSRPAAPRPRNELLLRIFLGRHAPPDVLLRDVAAYRAQMVAALEQLRAVEQRIAASSEDTADAVYWRLVIGFGVDVYAALDRWGEVAERELRRLG